jgi:hypothetical protein
VFRASMSGKSATQPRSPQPSPAVMSTMRTSRSTTLRPRGGGRQVGALLDTAGTLHGHEGLIQAAKKLLELLDRVPHVAVGSTGPERDEETIADRG